MKVLFITVDGLTDPLGQSQIIPYLSELAVKGYQISILSCEKPERFVVNKKIIEDKLQSVGILWAYTSYRSAIPFLSQRLNVFNLKQKAKKLHKEHHFDVIHCRSYIPALIGLNFKKAYHTGFIFDMRGFWANERLDGGIWKLSNPVHKKAFDYFKKKELEFMRSADYIVSLTEAGKKEIISWESLSDCKLNIKVIPCCVDLGHFSFANTSKGQLDRIRKELAISPKDFIISYLGSLGTWYMLEEMLHFFKRLLVTKPSAKFLFITPDNKDEILNKAIENGIDTNKLIIKSASRNEVPLLLNLSSFSLYFIKPLYSKKASSPTKMAEILACGLPFITNSGVGDSDEIIENTQTGILVKSFDDKAYDEAIQQIEGFLAKEKVFYRDVAEQSFSLNKGVEVYSSIYSELKEKYSR